MLTFYAYREDGTLTVYPHDEEELRNQAVTSVGAVMDYLNAHGYTKETWHMNDNGQIYYWDEQINKNSAPSLSPNMKQLY